MEFIAETSNTCHEDHRGDDVATSWIALRHAKGWTQDEGDGHDGSDHRQVMLEFFFSDISSVNVLAFGAEVRYCLRGPFGKLTCFMLMSRSLGSFGFERNE